VQQQQHDRPLQSAAADRPLGTADKQVRLLAEILA
jgi:hypothetical protein